MARSGEWPASATGTLIRLRDHLQSLRFDVTAASSAAEVFTAVDTGERHVHLLQQSPRGLLDAVQDIVVFALRRLVTASARTMSSARRASKRARIWEVSGMVTPGGIDVDRECARAADHRHREKYLPA